MEVDNMSDLEMMISRFKCYKAWCKFKGLKPSKPESLKLYLKFLREDE